MDRGRQRIQAIKKSIRCARAATESDQKDAQANRSLRLGAIHSGRILIAVICASTFFVCGFGNFGSAFAAGMPCVY